MRTSLLSQLKSRRRNRWPSHHRPLVSSSSSFFWSENTLSSREQRPLHRHQHYEYIHAASLLDSDISQRPYKQFQDGPPLELGLASFGKHASSSIVGLSGSTVVTSTVCTETSSKTFLTVDVRLRDHAAGKIPTNHYRRDHAMMSSAEILASRAVDRAVRPLLLDKNQRGVHYHVNSVVQSIELSRRPSGHPIAVAINTVSAALYDYLVEPVAATCLCVMEDGIIIVQDPSPTQIRESCGELLLAGTRKKIVMMEWTSHTSRTGLAEEQWQGLLDIGMAALQPLLDTVEQMQDIKATHDSHAVADSEADIRSALGLRPLPATTETESTSENKQLLSADETEQFINDGVRHCNKILHDSLYRLFGYLDEQGEVKKCNMFEAFIHKDMDLLSKSLRGARETIMRAEIIRVVDDFMETSGYALDEATMSRLQEKVIDKVCREALWETVSFAGLRSDQRGSNGKGWKSIRPIRVQVPALPDTVHGSALFARGETQVLCTVTLGAPAEGLPRADPFEETEEKPTITESDSGSIPAYRTLPVGSLRFLRSQQALVSDLNSKNIQAGREPLGASGSLSELKRAFLQYDFPSYSTGKVSDTNQAAKRRSVGHGHLAERAILPVIPFADDFPYAIRMTSEVTDSNGSSSMAAICGTTMALLDAGVPLSSPVAGISVGAVANSKGDEYALMLDITGTEDFYGAMDLKVAGTSIGVTALQMDTKVPLPASVIVDALHLARAGRQTILQEMDEQSISLLNLNPRPELKQSAPRVEIVRFDPQRKRDAVGPGGVVLRQLEDRYGVSLDLTQEGKCLIFGQTPDMVQKAKATIMDLVSDVVVGDTYKGTVIEIKDFGAVVELLRNKEGLLHVSELTDAHDPGSHPKGTSGFVREYLKEGQEIDALVIGIDPVQGSIKLSMKESRKRQFSYQ